jgi:CO/xanthine dehydrogenase FAD-binding subunit
MVQMDMGRLKGPHALLVDVSRIDDLRRISLEGDNLVVGAAATMADVQKSPLVQKYARALAEGAAAAASPQIRAVATVGGNIVNASPAADTAAALVAVGAVAEIFGPGGSRNVPVADFASGPGRTCLGQGEILSHLRVPLFAEPDGQAFMKLGRRQALSISLVNAAARVRVEGKTILEARLALGAVAPTVVLIKAAQELMAGKEPSDVLWRELEMAVRNEVSPIDDLRASAGYRRDMAGVYGRRVLTTAYERAQAGTSPGTVK